MRDLRVALIGCGHVSRYHLRAWSSCPGAKVVAVCDPRTERARTAAMLAPGATIHDDADMAIAAARPDVLDIATRSECHRALIELAARRGIDVLCQKPLCRSAAEARDAVAAGAAAGVRVAVMEIARFVPWMTALAEHCDRIGLPFHYRHIGERDGGRVSRLLRDQPYLSDERELIIRERVIHSIDAARFVLGDVETVFARAARIRRDLAGEDFALVVLGHRTGATSVHDFSWVAGPSLLRSHDECLSIEGPRGTLTLSFPDGRLRLVTDAETELATFDRASGFQSGFDRAIRSFVGAVASGGRLAYSAADNLNTLDATEAAYRSAATGRVVELQSGSSDGGQ